MRAILTNEETILLRECVLAYLIKCQREKRSHTLQPATYDERRKAVKELYDKITGTEVKVHIVPDHQTMYSGD